MLHVSALLFAVAAVGGLTLATLHFKGKKRPWPLALLHGLLAGTALILLLLPVLAGDPAAAGLKWAAALFAVAVLGGTVLFAHHLRQKPLPSAVVLIHGGVAVAALATLLITLYF